MAVSPYTLIIGIILVIGGTTSALHNEHEIVFCQDDQPACLSCEASCHADKCDCDSGHGHGYLACHNEHQHYCHIINDPKAWTFAKEDFDLPLPCRFLASHVKAKQYYQDWLILECRTQVHAFNTRSLGKFFVGGFDVMVEYMHTGFHQLHFKVTGSVSDDGKYSFELSVKEGFDENAPFSTSYNESAFDPSLGEVLFKVEEKNHRAVLSIENCGVELIYRPAHPRKGIRQTYMPGLAIAYDARYDLEWLDLDQVMCLSPDQSHTSTGKVAAEADMSPSEVFIWRASNHAPPQNIQYPGFTSTCNVVVNSVKECTNNAMHKEAIEMCAFIIGSPLFVNCFSKTSEEVYTSEATMALFGECIEAFCSREQYLCRQVHRQIDDAGCAKHSFDGFKEHQCAFT